MSANNIWALVLAAGEGRRLHRLTTTPGGLTIPKQFCSLQGGASLLEQTFWRARAVAQRGTVTVVAAQHRRWWESPLRAEPPDNVIVQPANKGTAIGVLLPLLHIAQRDPNATVVVLPSDHFVLKETVLGRALQQAARLACVDRRHVYMLGLIPEEIDQDLGYIVPGDGGVSSALPVRRFIEKPSIEITRELVRAGALCNVFILAGSARGLIGLYAARYGHLVKQLTHVAAQDALRTRDAPATEALYPQLPVLDFSRDVLEGQESQLRVLTLPPCGWSDLGTPRRVADTLSRIGHRGTPRQTVNRTAHWSLAAQQSQIITN